MPRHLPPPAFPRAQALQLTYDSRKYKNINEPLGSRFPSAAPSGFAHCTWKPSLACSLMTHFLSTLACRIRRCTTHHRFPAMFAAAIPLSRRQMHPSVHERAEKSATKVHTEVGDKTTCHTRRVRGTVRGVLMKRASLVKGGLRVSIRCDLQRAYISNTMYYGCP